MKGAKRVPDPEGWFSLDGSITPEAIRSLAENGRLERLSLTRGPLINVTLARQLADLHVEWLWLWCEVTPRALACIVQLSGLRKLDVLTVRGPGRFANFSKAANLQVFRANHGMSEADLLELARCVSLREIGAQYAQLSRRALLALLSLPELTALDLEGTCFDDRMARWISRSGMLTNLDLGGTRLTGAGLGHLVRMQQLRSLDLWATRLTEKDLPMLLELPNLEYLSLGDYAGVASLGAEPVTQFILEAPSLKRVWLDGIKLQPAQKKALESRLDTLRHT